MWEQKDAFYEDVQDTNWWWGKARREIVQQCINKVVSRPTTILEIGAGYGSMTRMLSNFGSVKAVEPYAEAASYLRDKLKINAYHGTFESFSDTEKYGLVTCFDVLEHIEDDKKALSRMGELVSDNGFLILTVPAYMFLWNRHDEINYHFRRYNKKQLIKILPPDFAIKKVSYFNTFLFPMAILDKLVLAKNKKSASLDPNKLVDTILYKIFSSEKSILRFTNLPFGVSLLLIAEKTNRSSKI